MSNAGTFLAIACRSTLATAFAVALWGKANGRAAFRSFAASLGELGLISRPFRTPVALSVALAEAVSIALLALSATATLGLFMSVAVIAAFTAGLGTSLIKGVRRPCHCLGASATPLSWLHVVRNLILLGFGLLGLVSGSAEAPETLPTAFAALAGATVAALIIRLDDLAELFQPLSKSR